MDDEEKYYSNLEQLYVHNVYESISHHYDEFFEISRQNSRKNVINESDQSQATNSEQHKYKAWPKVKQFVMNLEPYSFIADIGCGEGKYLNLNSKILSIGCDHSSSLCQLASAQKFKNSSINNNQILTCDNLMLPFRSDLFDAVISIGVIHHFSSVKRRGQAIQELTRILKPGGKIMIYVWAMEQRLRKFNYQDVLVPLLNTCPTGLTSKTPKAHLRRDLSNNSENGDKYYVDNENNVNNSKSHSLGGYQHQLTPESNIKGSDLLLAELDLNQEKKKADILNNNLDAYDGDFVSNLKGFFTKKFSSGNLRKQSSNETLNTNPVDSDCTFKFDMFDRYQKIIEDHKHLLPKNFTIRQFPFSSCPDTFDAGNEKTNTENSTGNNTIHSNSHENLKSCSNEQKSSEDEDIDDMNNNLNKRFYHVFKKNELDELVKSFSTSLSIYESYYDHGNWCICAIKNK